MWQAGWGVQWRMDTRICMAESLLRSPEMITALLIDCTPVQNKKLKTRTKWVGQKLDLYVSITFGQLSQWWSVKGSVELRTRNSGLCWLLRCIIFFTHSFNQPLCTGCLWCPTSYWTHRKTGKHTRNHHSVWWGPHRKHGPSAMQPQRKNLNQPGEGQGSRDSLLCFWSLLGLLGFKQSGGAKVGRYQWSRRWTIRWEGAAIKNSLETRRQWKARWQRGNDRRMRVTFQRKRMRDLTRSGDVPWTVGCPGSGMERQSGSKTDFY